MANARSLSLNQHNHGPHRNAGSALVALHFLRGLSPKPRGSGEFGLADADVSHDGSVPGHFGSVAVPMVGASLFLFDWRILVLEEHRSSGTVCGHC